MSKLIAKNPTARHNYTIIDTLETGIVLSGTEIKSIRNGKVNLKDSYAGIRNGELFIYNLHISPYEFGRSPSRWHHPARKSAPGALSPPEQEHGGCSLPPAAAISPHHRSDEPTAVRILRSRFPLPARKSAQWCRFRSWRSPCSQQDKRRSWKSPPKGYRNSPALLNEA